MNFRESLILATATGTAAVMTSGVGLCRKKDVEKIKKGVRMERL
jgi:fructose-1-phosphate kinase PfkB-like protein